MHRFRFWVAGVALAVSCSGAVAQQQQPAFGSGQTGAALPVGGIQMPLVTPAEADAFLSARTVPVSTVPAATKLRAADQTQPIALDVPTVLKHELPTDGATPPGFSRADFATAKQGADKKQDPLGATVTVKPQQSGPAIIREELPEIGKP